MEIAAKAPTNRTNLELKQSMFDEYTARGSYQSYQSGIETSKEAIQLLSFFPYQSYQSGIETPQLRS